MNTIPEWSAVSADSLASKLHLLYSDIQSKSKWVCGSREQ